MDLCTVADYGLPEVLVQAASAKATEPQFSGTKSPGSTHCAACDVRAWGCRVEARSPNLLELIHPDYPLGFCVCVCVFSGLSLRSTRCELQAAMLL